MSIEKVVVIIPTYNEACVIEETLTQVFLEIQGAPHHDVHVLVFDSHSTDLTGQILAQLQARYPKLHIQTEQQKSGLGSAYLQAMRYALDNMSADIVVEFDADLSHQPKYLLPMLEQMKTHDVVLGSRYVRGGSIPKAWGWDRKLLSVLGNVVARVVLSPKYRDFTSGFRATHRRVLEKVLPKRFLSNQYAYKLELLWLLHQHRARICEFPIDFIDREKGISKMPTNNILDSLRVVFTLRYRSLKSYFKMCLVGLSGVFIQFLVYNLLRQNMSPITAEQIAIMAAIANNFVLNNRFTFRDSPLASRHRKIKALGLFVGYSVLMVAFQSYWLHVSLSTFGAGYLKENITMATGILIGSLFNYVTYTRLIWHKVSS
ncbi:MAG: glycosyltransferase family 2 protein [Legionellales bacterium]|nr:glycosyltransferase family 2 protein [Legionellales bacterium]